MNLDQLQRVWDAQRQSPLYALDESALLQLVQGRNAASERRAITRYRWEIALGLACGLLMLVVAALLAFAPDRSGWLAGWIRTEVGRWEVPALLVAGAIWFYFAAYLRRARHTLAQAGETFDADLRGEIQRSLARLEFQISHARSVVLRGLVPVWVAAGLWVVVLFRLVDSPPAGYLLLATLWAAAFVQQTRAQLEAIDTRYAPERRELQSLQRQLAEESR
ncbi:MAG: hypothetical protein JSR82_19960 [Verrucomicrobia bacterium]|nr:hypothetical protein [Verrucomicrobiota bacterium]